MTEPNSTNETVYESTTEGSRDPDFAQRSDDDLKAHLAKKRELYT